MYIIVFGKENQISVKLAGPYKSNTDCSLSQLKIESKYIIDGKKDPLWGYVSDVKLRKDFCEKTPLVKNTSMCSHISDNVVQLEKTTTIAQSQLPKCEISNIKYKIIGYIYPSVYYNNLLTSELS